MTYCHHDRVYAITAGGQPVTSPRDVAAYTVCRACGVHLPVHWDCSNCEFAETPVFGEPRGLRFTETQPCVAHTDWRPPPTMGGGARA